MSKRYHITPDGPKPCTATQKACQYGNHYSDIEEAQKAMDTIYEMQEHDFEIDYSKPLKETDEYKEYAEQVEQVKSFAAEEARKRKAFDDLKDAIDKSLVPNESGKINGIAANYRLGSLYYDLQRNKPIDITKEQLDELGEHVLRTLAPYSKKVISDANEALAREVGTDPDKAVAFVLNDLSELDKKLNQTARKVKGIFKLRKFLYRQEYEDTKALYKKRQAQLKNYSQMINDKISIAAHIENKVENLYSSLSENYLDKFRGDWIEDKDISPFRLTKIDYNGDCQTNVSTLCLPPSRE